MDDTRGAVRVLFTPTLVSATPLHPGVVYKRQGSQDIMLHSKTAQTCYYSEAERWEVLGRDERQCSLLEQKQCNRMQGKWAWSGSAADSAVMISQHLAAQLGLPLHALGLTSFASGWPAAQARRLSTCAGTYVCMYVCAYGTVAAVARCRS